MEEARSPSWADGTAVATMPRLPPPSFRPFVDASVDGVCMHVCVCVGGGEGG